MNTLNNPHPGKILNEDVIKPLGLSISEVANRLGLSRASISRVINGRCGISYDLAVRLEAAGVSTARFWISLQAEYDLARTMANTNKDTLKNIVPIINNQAEINPLLALSSN